MINKKAKVKMEIDFDDERSKALFKQLIESDEGADIVLRDCHVRRYEIDYQGHREGVITFELFAHSFWSKQNDDVV